MSRFAFPDNENPEAELFQVTIMSEIAGDIALQLWFPVCRVRAWLRCETAARVAMPKAAVDEDDPSLPAVDQIGLAWKV
jgi:hypothetical protein